GTIDLTVSGGTAPYSFAWSNGSSSEDISGLVAGSYTVTITDANGCTDTQVINVTQPVAALSASGSPVHVKCFGGATGAINLTVSGGTAPYSFAWNTGATTEDLSGLTSGSYTVTITDANGCTETQVINVTQPAAALSASATPVHVKCFGGATGSIDLTVSGGTAPYSFAWNTGATTEDLTGLTSGSYTVTITDANGCTDTQVINVTQ